MDADEFSRRLCDMACDGILRKKKILDVSGSPHIAGLEGSVPISENALLLKDDYVSSLDLLDPQTAQIRTLWQIMTAPNPIPRVGGDHYRKTYPAASKQHILDFLRLREVEAVILQRFGSPACRIFRLLLLKNNLEQRQVADLAMIPVKDTRESLYKLLKAEYVQIQEVARTSDHAPSRTFYLWRVDIAQVIQHVGYELNRAVSNLRCRLINEISFERETLSLLKRAQERTMVPLIADQRSNMFRMRRTTTRLECSLLRLDELVLIFHMSYHNFQ